MSDEPKNTADAVLKTVVTIEAEKKPDQIFVVQMEEKVHREASEQIVAAWMDIATVTIPANTPRRIALKEALKDAGFVPGTGPVKLRALDAKSAEVHEPEAVQPPMEWRI